MTAEPVYVPDDPGNEDEDVAWRRAYPDPILADPDDPESDYLHAESTIAKSGNPSRPLVAGRCERIKKNGKRCRQWQAHGFRYCVVHAGLRGGLPSVKEYHEQTVHNAKMALMRMAPAALTRIETLIEDDETPPAVALRASTEVLDRTGVRGGVELDITVEEVGDPAADLHARLEQLRTRADAAAQRALDARTIPGEVVTDDGQMDLFAEEVPE